MSVESDKAEVPQIARQRTSIQTRIVEWLADWLHPWFIPRVDYDESKQRQSDSYWRARQAEETTAALHRELNQMLEESYSRSFRPFEYYSDSMKVTEFRQDTVDLTGETLGWQIRLDHARFYSMSDPRQELNRIKEYALEQLTRTFRERLREKLFSQREPRQARSVSNG